MSDDENDEISARKADSLQKLAAKNFGRFAVQVQHMSEAVQMKLIEQLPEFRKLAIGALESNEKAFQATLDSNDESDRHVHDGYREWRAALTELLSAPDLSLEDKLRITAEIGRTVEGQHQLNVEGKAFKSALFRNVLMGTLAAVAVVAVVVTGGKLGLDDGSSSSS